MPAALLLAIAPVLLQGAPVVVDPWCTARKMGAAERALGVTGPLVDVSDRFREAALRAREAECAALEHRGLVITYAFGQVQGHFDGVDLGPPVSAYTPYAHALKAVSHTALLVELLAHEPKTDAQEHARAARGDVVALRSSLADRTSVAAKLFANDADVARQTRILDASAAALDAIEHGAFDDAKATVFYAAVRAPVLEDMREASASTVKALDAAVRAIRTAAEAKDANAWKSVLVVAAVAHQAREQEIGVQYFTRLLAEHETAGAKGEVRVVVAEGVGAPADQHGLLATHVVDRAASTVLFDDPARLQWDVLGDSGGALAALLPAAP